MKIYLIRANRYGNGYTNTGRVRLATADKELAEDILKRIGRKYYIEESEIQK